MNFTHPLGLVLAAAVPLFFFIMTRAVRRRKVDLSSFYLIREIADALPLLPRSFLRRKKIQIALFLTALLLLAAAAAGPLLGSLDDDPVRAVIVLDHRSVLRDRQGKEVGWPQLVERARRLMGRLRSDDRVMLVRPDVGSVTEGFVSPRRASSAASALAPSHSPTGPDHMTDLLNLLDRAGRPDLVAIFTPAPSRWAGVPAGSSWQIIAVPVPTLRTNLSILDMDIRRNLLRPDRLDLFCRAGFFTTPGAADAADATLVVTSSGRPVAREKLRIPADRSLGVLLTDVEVSEGLLEVRLEPSDRFPDDNVFSTPLRSRPFIDAALVTAGNHALESALRSIPGLSLDVSGPGEELPESGRSLAVYDGLVPESLSENTLLIRPFASLPGLQYRGDSHRPRSVTIDRTSPLVDGVFLESLSIKRLSALLPSPSLEVLARADGYPLLLAGESESGARLAVIGFDPVESGWTHDPSFPILIANLVTWLSTDASRSGSSYRVGDSLPREIGEAARSIIDPSGRRQTLESGRSGDFIFHLAGRYRIEGDRPELSGDIFVNLVDERVSREVLSPLDAGTIPRPLPHLPRPFRVELAAPFILSGILLLVLELLIAPKSTVGRLP